ncbi:MAG: lysophospholipid acyltransferase family protein [Balneolaceae bacterium]
MRNNYLWYQFFRHWIVGTGLRIFHSSYKATGRENIPKDKPVLYIPNHQNSFMDAFLVTAKTSPVMYFLTRAKAFQPPILGWFLRSLNMLPVYRVRDGFSSIQKNNAIFEQCISYLKKKETVLVFAEANHKLQRRIRPLSKGFTRIAFGAEEDANWDLDLQIIPVGINYSRHQDSRNPVHVKFGKPIPVKQFQAAYAEDENAASQEMKEKTEAAMKKLVMHVPKLEEYAFYKILLDDLETDRRKVVDPDLMNHRVSLVEEHVTEDLVAEAKELDKLATKNKVRLYDVAYSKKYGVWDFLLFPIYLFSFINNILPYQPVRYLISNVIKDHAFDASIKFLTGIFILPIFYLIVSAILLLSGVSFPVVAGYFLISLFTAPAFIRAKRLFLPHSASRLKKSKPALYKKIKKRLQVFKDLHLSILNE